MVGEGRFYEKSRLTKTIFILHIFKIYMWINMADGFDTNTLFENVLMF